MRNGHDLQFLCYFFQLSDPGKVEIKFKSEWGFVGNAAPSFQCSSPAQ